VAASFAAFFIVQSDPFLLFQSLGERYAFYMPYTRAWELGLGAIIAFLPEITDRRFARYRRMLPWVGFALISAAVCQLGSTVDLTGNRIVAAAVGASFIIFAIEPKTRIHRILSAKLLVFVGKISYSLYLWHFPTIVFWCYYSGAQTIPLAYFGPFILSITVMAWLSWRYIEEPFRRAALNWQLVFAGFAGAALTVGYACWTVVATHGALARIPDSVWPLRSRDATWQWQCPSWHLVGRLNLCTGGTPWESAAGHAVIWGDSNAAHFMPLLDVAGRQQNVSISLTPIACSSIVATGFAEIGSATYVRRCDAEQRAILDALRSKEIGLVILSSAWYLTTAYFDRLGANGVSISKAALTRLLPQVSAKRRIVAIISEIPKWREDPIPCIFALQTNLLRSRSFREACPDRINRFDKSFFRKSQKATDDMIRSFDVRNGVVVWPMVDILCLERLCTTMVDGEFIYRDNDHLRRNLNAQTNLDLAAMLHFADLLELAKNGVTGPVPVSRRQALGLTSRHP
jgi:SGNH domain-containing protein/acyltransferase-like protein